MFLCALFLHYSVLWVRWYHQGCKSVPAVHNYGSWPLVSEIHLPQHLSELVGAGRETVIGPFCVLEVCNRSLFTTLDTGVSGRPWSIMEGRTVRSRIRNVRSTSSSSPSVAISSTEKFSYVVSNVGQYSWHLC